MLGNLRNYTLILAHTKLLYRQFEYMLYSKILIIFAEEVILRSRKFWISPERTNKHVGIEDVKIELIKVKTWKVSFFFRILQNITYVSHMSFLPNPYNMNRSRTLQSLHSYHDQSKAWGEYCTHWHLKWKKETFG